MNHLEALTGLLHQAGELMMSYRHPQVYSKGHHADFVTEADKAVQTMLMTELHRLYPSARFYAEERQDNVLTDALTFIIDPIDGTTNYFRGRQACCISVGAVENRTPLFGGIYAPALRELYLAERGKGATCNGTPIHVSDVPLERALIGLGTSPYYDDLFAVTGDTVGKLLPHIADYRRSGSAALDLCDIAAGRSEGSFEWLLQPWDYCAGTLLVEEAGGQCGNILGGPVTYEKAIPHLAANARCFAELQRLLQSIHGD